MPITVPDFPLADADKCVKCALCLPHCPTWRETRNEAESPRGRIALMQGFATGALEITPRLAAHLNQCLGCRACEAVCPADVPYGKLIDAAHEALQSHAQRESWLARTLAWWLRRAWRLQILHRLLWFGQTLGVLRLAGLSGPLRRLTGLLPVLHGPHRRRTRYPATGARRGAVNLFLGCIARITEPRVTDASIAVLNAAGYEVRVPPTQTCCGALDQHAGRSRHAARLAAINLAAFGTNDAAVLSTASGCGATLMEYPRIPDAPAPAFADRHRDISQFLATQGALDAIAFSAWPATVVLHAPCTLRNVLKSDQHTLALLQHIPELNIVTLPAGTGCCGAAGSYLLNQPRMADRLGGQLAGEIAAKQPAALVTSNVGCAMHLAAALARRGQPLPVMHPLEVLARQLPRTYGV
ncbi:MAG TPA: (Fe-S)-binding protein [Gammaproteobacteria bacterium]|nr:(Fe-S)-binding protein [Gammaproteobacteria bacterium]